MYSNIIFMIITRYVMYCIVIFVIVYSIIMLLKAVYTISIEIYVYEFIVEANKDFTNNHYRLLYMHH